MNNRFAKTLVGVTLSLSIFTAGTTMLGAKSAYAASAPATAAGVIAAGQQFMGVPYQFGAKSGRTDRFDCSSFTQHAFAMNGIKIPRDSRQQSTVGTNVSKDQLQPGDLVFFYSPIHHVAIYMGNGKLLHTFGKAGVTITNFNGWWSNHFTTARRVLPTGQAAPVITAPQPAAPVVVKATQPVQKNDSTYSTHAKRVKHTPIEHAAPADENNQEGEN